MFKVELALGPLLDRYGLRRRGTIKQLAEALQIQEAGVHKILTGVTQSISYDNLGLLCSWLMSEVQDPQHRRELQEGLPGLLLRYAGLWGRLLSSRAITFCVGVRYLPEDRGRSGWPERRWISGADSEVAASIVQALTKDGGHFELNWLNAPLHLPLDDPDARRVPTSDDLDAAQAALEQMRRTDTSSMFVIGSMKVNPLSELFLAEEVFRVKPFVDAAGVPFRMRYREYRGFQPHSCFGGYGAPQGVDDRGPGIYYLDTDRVWKHCAWNEGVSGAGVSVIVEDPGRSKVVVVLFGFSGLCTERLGQCFLDRQRFISPTTKLADDRRIAAYCWSLDYLDVKRSRAFEIAV